MRTSTLVTGDWSSGHAEEEDENQRWSSDRTQQPPSPAWSNITSSLLFPPPSQLNILTGAGQRRLRAGKEWTGTVRRCAAD